MVLFKSENKKRPKEEGHEYQTEFMMDKPYS